MHISYSKYSSYFALSFQHQAAPQQQHLDLMVIKLLSVIHYCYVNEMSNYNVLQSKCLIVIHVAVLYHHVITGNTGRDAQALPSSPQGNAL